MKFSLKRGSWLYKILYRNDLTFAMMYDHKLLNRSNINYHVRTAFKDMFVRYLFLPFLFGIAFVNVSLGWVNGEWVLFPGFFLGLMSYILVIIGWVMLMELLYAHGWLVTPMKWKDKLKITFEL